MLGVNVTCVTFAVDRPYLPSHSYIQEKPECNGLMCKANGIGDGPEDEAMVHGTILLHNCYCR